MRFKQRPSFKEIEKKLHLAKKAIAEGKVAFGPNLDKLVNEFTEMRIGHSNEIWTLLKDLLEEIKPEHYAGPHPPMSAIEPSIKNSELFIFIWNSKIKSREMYLKFAVKNDFFYYISLHFSNRSKKGWNFVPNFTPQKN